MRRLKRYRRWILRKDGRRQRYYLSNKSLRTNYQYDRKKRAWRRRYQPKFDGWFSVSKVFNAKWGITLEDIEEEPLIFFSKDFEVRLSNFIRREVEKRRKELRKWWIWGEIDIELEDGTKEYGLKGGSYLNFTLNRIRPKGMIYAFLQRCVAGNLDLHGNSDQKIYFRIKWFEINFIDKEGKISVRWKR